MQKTKRLFVLQNVLVSQIKHMSAARTAIKLDDKVNQDLENVVYKPRKHPGVMRYKNISLPTEIVKAIEASTQDYPMKTLVQDGQALNRYLKARHPPPTPQDLKDKYEQIYEKFERKGKLNFAENLSEERRLMAENNVRNEIVQKCKQQTYGWRAISYDEAMALTYAFGRSAQEYAVLVRVFGEIHDRLEDFKPRSFLDFGSGIGTGTWAARFFWQSNLFEYFCVDASSAMNDLADILLRGGRGNKVNPLKVISYRQFLPASTDLTYDIVLCAYTLFEMSTPELRLEKLLKLWNKTEQFLVIVEHGTNAGFKLISEARDFLLGYNAEIFAPCPHSKPCPRFLDDDNSPCNFEVRYSSLPLAAISRVNHEQFSYVVLRKKTKRPESEKNPFSDEDIDVEMNRETSGDDATQNGGGGDSVTSKWPRIVRPTLVRAKHTVCRMCTADGCLKEVVVTAAKHGKMPYYCVRSSNWGDLLPVTLANTEKTESGEENGVVKNENDV